MIWMRSDSAADAVDTISPVIAIARHGAIAGRLIGRHTEALKAVTKLHIVTQAVTMGVTGGSADAVHTGVASLTIGVALTERGGAFVHSAHTALTDTTITTVGVGGTSVQTNRIDADLTGTAVSIGHTLTGHGRDIFAASLGTLLPFRTCALFITGGHAGTVDA